MVRFGAAGSRAAARILAGRARGGRPGSGPCRQGGVPRLPCRWVPVFHLTPALFAADGNVPLGAAGGFAYSMPQDCPVCRLATAAMEITHCVTGRWANGHAGLPCPQLRRGNGLQNPHDSSLWRQQTIL
jgi:hypothetical protein